jgi:broad specificity phosphatase PhoE
LLFVRHAESVSGVEGTFGGPHGCRGLTAPGREQAEKLGQRLAAELRDTPPVSVYSSTLRRAIETAAVIAAALGLRRPKIAGNEPGAELVSRGSRAILDALPVFRSSRRPRLGDRVGH